MQATIQRHKNGKVLHAHAVDKSGNVMKLTPTPGPAFDEEQCKAVAEQYQGRLNGGDWKFVDGEGKELGTVKGRVEDAKPEKSPQLTFTDMANQVEFMKGEVAKYAKQLDSMRTEGRERLETLGAAYRELCTLIAQEDPSKLTHAELVSMLKDKLTQAENESKWASEAEKLYDQNAKLKADLEAAEELATDGK